MDEDATKRQGLASLQEALAAISAVQDKTVLIALLAILQHQGVDGLLDVEIAPDARAEAVFGFETRLATAHWSEVDKHDIGKTQNR